MYEAANKVLRLIRFILGMLLCMSTSSSLVCFFVMVIPYCKHTCMFTPFSVLELIFMSKWHFFFNFKIFEWITKHH